MSNHEVDAIGSVKDRRERPFLYPWNRRLRHLRGISLRNLHLTASKQRKYGKTNTDDDLLYTRVSPAKQRLHSEAKGLSHSRSFSELAIQHEDDDQKSFLKGTTFHDDIISPKRMKLGKLRRRSTLHFSNANPRSRQEKLEDVASDRMVDTWFSIHVDKLKEPIYVSEVMHFVMNPTFSQFGFDTLGAEIKSVDKCIVKVWSKSAKTEVYNLLVELTLYFQSLQYIGRSIESFHHPLPDNCILLHLTDGIYTSFTDMPTNEQFLSGADTVSSTRQETTTSSFDALMELANLDECIQDALRSRQKFETEIDSLLEKHRVYRSAPARSIEQRERTSATKSARESERRGNAQLERRRDEMRKQLDMRRHAISEAVSQQSMLQERLAQVQALTRETSLNLDRTRESASGQIRRICETQSLIFPIEPLKTRALQFSIRSIALPNSVFDDTNRDEIAAALGFTAQLVRQLSLYLAAPLPYPLEINSSNSFIEDPISLALAQRKFPLHPTNISYKFEYGVFLLNKDIEFLMSKAGLRIIDIRHTLPNLKYLLYVLTAGSGELPSRKAGGIIGLTGAGRGIPGMLRRTSQDSLASHDFSVRRASTSPINADRGSQAALPREKKGQFDDDPFQSPGKLHAMPYRQSLLRDDG